MTPAELCKSGSEHGEQRALFAWCKMAEQYGFVAAWDDKCYSVKDYASQTYGCAPSLGVGTSHGSNHVPELKWYHAIPNGGSRGDDKKSRAIRGMQLKSEGVKPGIPDTFLPLPMWAIIHGNGLMDKPTRAITYAGLYVEMKRAESEGRAKGSTSIEQDEAIAWLRHSGYAVTVVFTWDQAARELQSYIEAVRRGNTRG